MTGEGVIERGGGEAKRASGARCVIRLMSEVKLHKNYNEMIRALLENSSTELLLTGTRVWGGGRGWGHVGVEGVLVNKPLNGDGCSLVELYCK